MAPARIDDQSKTSSAAFVTAITAGEDAPSRTFFIEFVLIILQIDFQKVAHKCSVVSKGAAYVPFALDDDGTIIVYLQHRVKDFGLAIL